MKRLTNNAGLKVATTREHDRRLQLTVPQKMAVACRTLHDRGHCSSLAGQVTTINRDQQTVLAPSMTRTFEEMRPEDFIEVDMEFRPRDEGNRPNPATLFHLWIYRARPDVTCVIHTHSPHACALSMLNVPLEVAHMDMCMFYEDCAHLSDWPGVPVADEEGRIISEALGHKRAILLANHGPLVVGRSVEEATYLSLMLEDAARLQLLAMAAGKISPIDPALAREAHGFLLQDSIVNMTFETYVRQVRNADPTLPLS